MKKDTVCINCKKTYKVWPYLLKTKKYCSRKCKKEYLYKPPKYCTLCNKQLGFTAQHSKKREIKYCWSCFKHDKKWQEGTSKTHFSSDKSSWNKGIHAQTNDALRTWRENGGEPAFKGKHSPICGEKHWNWKGGKSSVNNKIRSSLEYKQWREAVFARDDWTCQFCGKRGGQTLHADHIKPFAYYPELRLELSNGRTLCVPCHKTTDTYGNKFRGSV